MASSGRTECYEDVDSWNCPSVTLEDSEPLRYGGAQAVQGDDSDEAQKKKEEHDRKVKEVRERLLAASAVKKAKKGFLTPDRKKKLRKLLLLKAAEDLKEQQLKKERERQEYLQSRILPLPDLDGISSDSELQKIAYNFHTKICELESVKYDLEYTVRQKDFELNELSIQVNDLRGKFVKPALKKVSTNDNKFAKLATKKSDKVDFKAQLKLVEKNKFSVDEVLKEKPQEEPEWAKK